MASKKPFPKSTPSTAPSMNRPSKTSPSMKQDMAMDKKSGIKENSKADLSKDAILQKLMSARSKK